MTIYLFCSGGFSTSLLAKKMLEAYHAHGEDVTVEAFDYGSLDDVAEEADVILLGPQISWAKDEVLEDYPDKKVMVMDMQDFGSMDGERMMKKVEALR